MFSGTFAGIAPASAPVFIAAEIGGGIAGVLVIRFLYPAMTPAQAAGVIVPHESADGRAAPDAGAGQARRVPGGTGQVTSNGREPVMHMVAVGGQRRGHQRRAARP